MVKNYNRQKAYYDREQLKDIFLYSHTRLKNYFRSLAPQAIDEQEYELSYAKTPVFRVSKEAAIEAEKYGLQFLDNLLVTTSKQDRMDQEKRGDLTLTFKSILNALNEPYLNEKAYVPIQMPNLFTRDLEKEPNKEKQTYCGGSTVEKMKWYTKKYGYGKVEKEAAFALCNASEKIMNCLGRNAWATLDGEKKVTLQKGEIKKADRFMDASWYVRRHLFRE